MTPLEERRETLALIDAAVVAGARIGEACRHAGLHRRTYRRWRSAATHEIIADARPEAVRPGPSNRLTKTEEAAVLAACHRPDLADAPPSQIVPLLADEGVYIASESSFYRVLHRAGEQHERGRARRRSARRPTSHRATGPNQLWSWDVSYLNSPTRGIYYYLYKIMDVWSRKIVGWEVHEVETGELAAELVARTTLGEGARHSALVLHADNGAPQRSSTLRAMLEGLGVTSSFSRPRVSDDNPYSEALFRTMKYRPDFPVHGFASIEAARTWVLEFVRWYNTCHRHGAIRFVTPDERHEGRDVQILEQRRHLYAQAKRRNPSRWSGATRDWERPTVVWLNPEKPDVVVTEENGSVAA